MAMDLNKTIWFSTLAVALCAGYLDWRSRRIPNWLTVSGFLTGLTLNFILSGWEGAVTSLEGAGLALGLLLPFVLLRGFGAGDWKLMGAIGALMGWHPMLVVLFIGVMISGIAAVIQMVATKRVKVTLWNLWRLVTGFMILGLRPNPEISLDNPTLAKLPFGTAVATATALCFVLARWWQ